MILYVVIAFPRKKTKKVIIHYYIKKKRKVQHSSRNNTFLELLDVIKKRVKCPSQLSFFGRFATFQKKAIKKGPNNSLSPTKSSTNKNPNPNYISCDFCEDSFWGFLGSLLENTPLTILGSNHYRSPLMS